MMSTNEAGATVVFLESHPAWLAARRRSMELHAAMRRHPSFQAAPDTSSPDDSHGAVVRHLHAL